MTLLIKKSLLAQTANHLELELAALRTAAAAAHDAATVSYTLQAALDLVSSMTPRSFQSHDAVGLTAQVKLTMDNSTTWYFLIQVAGGYTLHNADKPIHGPVFTLTPQTPLGRALVGKRIGDNIVVRTEKGEKEYELSQLY